MKTALLIAATLAAALVIGCSRTDDVKPVLAPITAECLRETYQNYNSISNAPRRTFALTKCMQDTDVRAELDAIPKETDLKSCQEREARTLPNHYPRRLAMMYAATVCIR